MNRAKRVPIPTPIQSLVLRANRHACCVCQKPRVQLHHINSNPADNDPANIAVLCTDHHDAAEMQLGLTKKLQSKDLREYKRTWEEICSADILALSRQRFTYYYNIYKNPPRIMEAYRSLSHDERARAVDFLVSQLPQEEQDKKKDALFGLNAVPRADRSTIAALNSICKGEDYPSYLDKFEPHPEDPNYSTDSSSIEAMSTFHHYDLWCQVIVQCLAIARGVVPLEDLLLVGDQDQMDQYAGSLISFKLTIRGKGVKIPREWKEFPTSSISGTLKNAERVLQARMNLRTMYLFSDTAAINLSNGRVSGLGILQGAVMEDKKTAVTLVPLVIGAGGWSLHPEYRARE